MKEQKRFKDYKEYLESPQWKALRKKTYDRVKEESGCANQTCEVCDIEDNLQVHHWKYPKDWNDDKTEYHTLVCKDCHETAHNYFTTDENFKSRDDFLKQLLRIKYNEAEEERIEYYNLLGIALSSNVISLTKNWNTKTKSFDGYVRMNGYKVLPSIEKSVIDLFKKL